MQTRSAWNFLHKLRSQAGESWGVLVDGRAGHSSPGSREVGKSIPADFASAPSRTQPVSAAGSRVEPCPRALGGEAAALFLPDANRTHLAAEEGHRFLYHRMRFCVCL